MSGYLEYFNPGMAWQAVALLATAVSIAIHALLVGMGKAFNLQDLEKYAQSEILQAVATVVMVGAVATSIDLADNFAVDYFIGPGQELPCGEDPMPVEDLGGSLDLLQCRMKFRAGIFATLQKDIIESAGSPLWRQGFYWAIFGIPVIQGAYFSDLYREIETYRILLNLTTNMLIVTNTVAVFTDYIKNNMLSLFLPLGLILRSFHFTRNIGAFFMAIAIGFHFVFPIMYLVTDPAYVRPSGYATPPVPEEGNSCFPTFTGVITQLVAGAGGSGGGGGGGGATSRHVALEELRNDISSVYFTVALHPFIALSLTLVVVRQLMYFLGGEGQDLMRMVSKVV